MEAFDDSLQTIEHLVNFSAVAKSLKTAISGASKALKGVVKGAKSAKSAVK